MQDWKNKTSRRHEEDKKYDVALSPRCRPISSPCLLTERETRVKATLRHSHTNTFPLRSCRLATNFTFASFRGEIPSLSHSSTLPPLPLLLPYLSNKNLNAFRVNCELIAGEWLAPSILHKPTFDSPPGPAHPVHTSTAVSAPGNAQLWSFHWS